MLIVLTAFMVKGYYRWVHLGPVSMPIPSSKRRKNVDNANGIAMNDINK